MQVAKLCEAQDPVEELSFQAPKMEDSLENWISHLEMEEYDLLSDEGHGSFDEQEFLREILEQPQPSTNHSTVSLDDFSGSGTLHKSNSSNSNSNSIKSLKRSPIVSPPTTYLVSFETSTAEPLTQRPNSPKLGDNKVLGSSNNMVKDGSEIEPWWLPQPRKKVRRPCETQDHIIAERKRRRELTGNIIALSATIPGLKKMDKAYVLREAVNYTKQLQERVKELENENKYKREVDPEATALIRKSQISSHKSSINCDMKEEPLFEIEARVLDEEVLIGIHCEKQKDIVLKIHEMLEKLHLSTTNSSVLLFGTSTLIINVIAQMNNKYIVTMDDLVEKLREYLLEIYEP